MSEDFPDPSTELSETQKLGTSIRWFGFSRIASIIGSIILAVIVSTIVTKSVEIPEGTTTEDTIEIIEAAMLVELGKPWALVLGDTLIAVVIIGIGYMVYNLYLALKSNPDDRNLSKVYYLFFGAMAISIIYLVLRVLIDFGNLSVILFWIAVILEITISGANIAGYLFFQRWSVEYEQNMGVEFPILSSRMRRLIIGEILIITGLFSSLFSLLVPNFFATGFFMTIGEVLVVLNLLKAGKLLELGTLPQTSYDLFGKFGQQQGSPPRTEFNQQQEYPEYHPPQKLIPDKAYFCPHCGSVLHSESQDFCMKCGKPIPKPENLNSSEEEFTSGNATDFWVCKDCGSENPESDDICDSCGKNRKSR